MTEIMYKKDGIIYRQADISHLPKWDRITKQLDSVKKKDPCVIYLKRGRFLRIISKPIKQGLLWTSKKGQ